MAFNSDKCQRIMSMTEASKLYTKSYDRLEEARSLLDEARDIASRVGLSVDSSILDSSYQSPFIPSQLNEKNDAASTPTAKSTESKDTSQKNTCVLNAFPRILSTTSGHSNTDHIIQVTGDLRADAIAEYKRKLKRRARAMQPEQRGADRWDQPRISGSRRRRIAREKDLPSAPPEPPPSGYVIFIAQMTTKMRHDRPNVHHNQIAVVQEISKIWKFKMSDNDRDYYNEFARDLREEYEQQHTEFRATGAYKHSRIFEKLQGDGPWVRIALHEKNALEREISNYETVKFPPRPANAQVPCWVTKIKKQNEREAKRKRDREEKLDKKRDEELRKLKEASIQKMKRLADVDKYKYA